MLGVLLRPVHVVCLLIVVVQAVLVVGLLRDPDTGKPHQVPVVIAAPVVVAESLTEESNALAGEPFDATIAQDEAAARANVRDGDVVAALLVRLKGTQDVLVVNPAHGEKQNKAVRDRIQVLEQSYHRSVDVQEEGRSHSESGSGPANTYRLALLTAVIGFALVLAVSLVRGPVARNVRLGALRLLGVAVAAALVGLVLTQVPGTSLPGSTLELTGVGALAILVAATTTLALESVAGLAGLAIACTVFLVLATPLLIGTDATLLPAPWPTLGRWTPTGATVDAAASLAWFDPSHGVLPVLVLLVWLFVSLATVLVARGVRDRYHVEVSGHPIRSGGREHLVRWRLRVLGVVAPVAVILVLPLAFAPTGVAAPANLPSKAAESTCVHVGNRDDVADLNRIAGTLRGSPEFEGGDVGADVELQDGRRLWLFGDTLRSSDFDGQQFVRNSMLVLDADGQGDCAEVVEPDNHGALVPDRPDGVGYWPMSLERAQRPGYDLVSVACQRVVTTGSGAFSFENLGTSIAVFVVRRGAIPQLIAQRDIGSDSSKKSRPTWGAATAVSNGWVYLYGTANPGKDYVFGFSLRVARVRPEDILDASRWRYWNGTSWVADAAKAKQLIPAEGGVSQTLSVFEKSGTWYALSKRDDFLGTDLVVWTAPAPTGPFTAAPPLAKLPSDTAKGELRYMPLAHPGLLPEKGSMVVSYSQNSTDVDKVEKNPLLYRPKFLRVDLP